MATFITIGYGNKKGYDGTPENIRKAAHEHDELLATQGVVMGIAGQPIQVRNTHNIKLQKKTGTFMSADLPVAGFAIIEADTVEEAINMVSKSPCAVADGVVEVWPLLTNSEN
jgi:hypothetical protein